MDSTLMNWRNNLRKILKLFLTRKYTLYLELECKYSGEKTWTQHETPFTLVLSLKYIYLVILIRIQEYAFIPLKVQQV